MKHYHHNPKFLSYLASVYCHVYEGLQMGFGLLTGFNDLLQFITIINSSAIIISHTLQSITARTLLSQRRLHQSCGNGF
jgi:hypothetical protein